MPYHYEVLDTHVSLFIFCDQAMSLFMMGVAAEQSRDMSGGKLQLRCRLKKKGISEVTKLQWHDHH